MTPDTAHRDHAIPPRNIKFDLTEECPRDWYDDDPAISRFFDGMSIVFPEGERFFIEAVRHYKDRIDDPRLLEQMRGFIAQEAIHGREHEVYNELMQKNGLPQKKLDAQFMWLITRAHKLLPWRNKLAGTCAAEHFTAMLADSVLSDPTWNEKTHPVYRDLWNWHAVEETEHKAVAYDVYQATQTGLGGYLRRVIVYSLVIMVLNIRFAYHWAVLMRATGDLNLKAVGRLFWFIWGKPGLYRRQLGAALAYFKPSYHPWDHDNRAQVEAWKELSEPGLMAAE